MYPYCNLAKKNKPQRIFNRLQSYKKDGIRPVTKEIKNQIQFNSKGWCEIRPWVNWHKIKFLNFCSINHVLNLWFIIMYPYKIPFLSEIKQSHERYTARLGTFFSFSWTTCFVDTYLYYLSRCERKKINSLKMQKSSWPSSF